MVANPKHGQLVRVWYNKRAAPSMPLHGKTGRVVIVSKGKPRNHGVEVDGTDYVVPCGNLQPVKGLQVQTVCDRPRQGDLFAGW